MLEKIRWSEKKKEEVLQIVRKPFATHSARLWATGFLKYVGYTKEEVYEFYCQNAEWSDFSEKETWMQTCSVFHNDHKHFSPISGKNHAAKRHVRKPHTAVSSLKRKRIEMVKFLPCGIDRSLDNMLTAWLILQDLPVYETMGI